MEIANQENVTPTDALLSLVRSAMGRASYVDEVLANHLRQHIEDGGDPLDPPTTLRQWMKESRQERLLAAKTAKAAIDAGVMVAMAQRRELEGALVAEAGASALDSLELSAEDRMKALGAAQEKLLNSE